MDVIGGVLLFFLIIASTICTLGTIFNWVIGEQDTLRHSIQNTVNQIVHLARRLW